MPAIERKPYRRAAIADGAGRGAIKPPGRSGGGGRGLLPSVLVGAGDDLLCVFGVRKKKLGPRLRGGDLLRACGAKQVGFTLIELILVIMLLGTLSYFAVARMVDRGDTDAHGFAEQLASMLRFAQKAAVAQRRNVYVNVDSGAGRVWACLDAALACTAPLAAPAGGPLEHNTPRGVSVASGGAAQLAFDALGRPSLANALDLSVTASAATFTVRIEPDSGYVRRL